MEKWKSLFYFFSTVLLAFALATGDPNSFADVCSSAVCQAPGDDVTSLK
jgi:hypothetical protein